MKLAAGSRWLSNPTVQIGILGILTWLSYLHLATTYPLADYFARFSLTDFGRANNWRSIVGADFILSVLGALLLCLLAWQIARRHPRNRKLFWLMVGFSLLFALTLLTMYPIAATDVFEYVFHSRILVHYGQNPLAVPPSAFKGDPFLKNIPWGIHASPYGPLWVVLNVSGSLLAGNDFLFGVFLMKALTIPFFLGSVLLIAAILQRMDP